VDAVEFRLLGPFEVRRESQLLAGGGGKRRALLAALLLSANRVVTVDQLSQALWGATPPRSASNLIQGYVSDWRSLLEPDRAPRSSGRRLLSTPSGYRLDVAPHECDVLRFRALAGEGRRAASAGDLLSARRLLREALQEWRGAALADFDDHDFQGAVVALDELRLAAAETAADVELQLDRPDRALECVQTLVELFPLRESLARLTVVALYRAGRQDDALTAYGRIRTALADELGIDPGPALSQLHLQVLRQDPSLDGPAPDSGATASLPVPLSPFVGRAQELAAVLDLAARHRMVTLTGSGGSGKTRLAIAAAAVVASQQERDVAFVDLSAVRDPDLLCVSIAGVLGGQLAPSLRPGRALAMQLGSRPTLLILDNMEQLIGAARDLSLLLSYASQVSVLATSREPLGLAGEQLFHVRPMALPADDAAVAGASALLAADAVRLFLDRARAADPDFVVADNDVRVVAGICRRLDGLPLALELAAPWTATLSLRALLERLDRPLALLVAGGDAAGRPDRHHTLRAAIEWSYTALSPDQRRLLDQLSVFTSGARLEAVEAVSDLGDAAVPALAALVDRNLVSRMGTTEPRYRLLETVREYARDQLSTQPEEHENACQRHVDYFCTLAEHVARGGRTPTGEDLVVRLGEEQDEIRAALDHLHERGDTRRTLTLVVDCLALWWDLGHTREGYLRLTAALDACGSDAPAELVAAGNAAATFLADAVGEPAVGLARARAATRHARDAGSPTLEGLGLCLEGNSLCWMEWSGTAATGIELLDRAASIAKTSPISHSRWSWCTGQAVVDTATLALAEFLRYRLPRRAHALVSSAWQHSAPMPEPYTASFILRVIGFLAANAGRWSEANECLTESLALATRARSRRSESRTLEELARLALAQGDVAEATSFADRATRLSRESGHALNWSRCAALLATIVLEQDDHERARRLLDEAAAALQPSYPSLAIRTVAPRRARLARLAGLPERAGPYLFAAAELEHAEGLMPDRVIYLVESAHDAAHRGDNGRAAELSMMLTRDAGRIGLHLPRPEVHHLGRLSPAMPDHAPSG
jgi:predicted ATPase/DNA-binding SARP family transcriptional activator